MNDITSFFLHFPICSRKLIDLTILNNNCRFHLLCRSVHNPTTDRFEVFYRVDGNVLNIVFVRFKKG